MYSDWEDVTSSGRAFQVFGPATGKARLPTVDRLFTCKSDCGIMQHILTDKRAADLFVHIGNIN